MEIKEVFMNYYHKENQISINHVSENTFYNLFIEIYIKMKSLLVDILK